MLSISDSNLDCRGRFHNRILNRRSQCLGRLGPGRLRDDDLVEAADIADNMITIVIEVVSSSNSF